MHLSPPSPVLAVVVIALLSSCGGSSAGPARAADDICESPPPSLPSGATFGDIVDVADPAPAMCLPHGESRVAVQWAAVDWPHIRLSPDAVDVGSSSTTVCAWYGRCDPRTGQRALLDDQSVASTVACLLETGPPGEIVVQASRDVSAAVLLSVVQQVTAAGRTVDVERRPVSFWYPCRPSARRGARGELPEDQLRAAVTPRIRELRRHCYSGSRVPHGHRGGRVLLRFTLAPDGSVEDVTNAASTLGLPDAEECVLAQVRTWTFPAPGGEESVVVTYPVEFGRQGRRR